LIRELEEFGMYVAMTGFRNAEIEDVNEFFTLVRKKAAGVVIQIFDANLIASWEHLYFAALNALTAFEGELNISNSLAMETLLYASAQRQIDKAIGLLGIKPESSQIAVLVMAKTSEEAGSALETISEMVSGDCDDGILELSGEKMEKIRRLFEVSDLELESKLERKGLERETLVDLVIEHVALLATQR
jgi:tRNA threonylcarbamoyladenosine modification (KEOPS) complex Cgi121 subunit